MQLYFKCRKVAEQVSDWLLDAESRRLKKARNLCHFDSIGDFSAALIEFPHDQHVFFNMCDSLAIGDVFNTQPISHADLERFASAIVSVLQSESSNSDMQKAGLKIVLTMFESASVENSLMPEQSFSSSSNVLSSASAIYSVAKAAVTAFPDMNTIVDAARDVMLWVDQPIRMRARRGIYADMAAVAAAMREYADDDQVVVSACHFLDNADQFQPADQGKKTMTEEMVDVIVPILCSKVQHLWQPLMRALTNVIKRDPSRRAHQRAIDRGAPAAVIAIISSLSLSGNSDHHQEMKQIAQHLLVWLEKPELAQAYSLNWESDNVADICVALARFPSDSRVQYWLCRQLTEGVRSDNDRDATVAAGGIEAILAGIAVSDKNGRCDISVIYMPVPSALTVGP